MRILFLTLSNIVDINQRGIYTDLLRELIKQGNDVYIASPNERRYKRRSSLIKTPHCQILKIRTLNIQKANVIEKGIGTLLLEYQFDYKIKKYWGKVKFELVLYATPPITFNNVIKNIKKRCCCSSYLMLKDIFPQNAVDLGMMKEGSFLHRIFRNKEKRLYEVSDNIGCMSPANCQYIIKHNPNLDPSRVELCPNAVEQIEIPVLSELERKQLLLELGIPTDKILFIYGGNLGKPQGLDFLLKVVEANETRNNSYIIIVGNGTEYQRILAWFKENKPQNAKLIARLSKGEYDNLVRACNVGLIFLDPRFTIPNFPSRLLSYLENSIPVLLATDTNTDIGRIAEYEGFGLWSKNGDIKAFMENFEKLTEPILMKKMGYKGKQFLIENYTTERIAHIIMNKR